MAKVTRLVAVFAFVLGAGLVVARDAGATHTPEHQPDLLANVFAQVNVAEVTQVNNVAQGAGQAVVIAQAAQCDPGNPDNPDAGCDTAQVVVVDDLGQLSAQNIEDVGQGNAAVIDQDNTATDIEQENETDN
jgi:hypothetical protein